MRRITLAIVVLAWTAAAFASPAAASTQPRPGAQAGVADHVDPADCDEIGLVGGVITVDGVALTSAQLAMVFEAEGVLMLAATLNASSQSEACIDVAGLPGAPVVNGHLSLCGAVRADADILTNSNAVVVVGGVAIPSDSVQTVDTIEALLVADAAGVDACLTADVVDTSTLIKVAPEPVCATTTLLDTGTLDLVIGSTPLTLGAISVTELTIDDPQGLLAVGQSVQVGLTLLATADRHLHAGTFTIAVSQATDCPVPRLPDAATRRDEAPLTTIGLAVVFLALAWSLWGRRRRGA